MIKGYDVGTEVKWNEERTLVTGVVEQVIHRSATVQIDGEVVAIEANENSPTYVIRHNSGRIVILPHTAVMREHTNLHT